jgi:hypothetical protein
MLHRNMFDWTPAEGGQTYASPWAKRERKYIKTHLLKLFCSGYSRTICTFSDSLPPGNNMMCDKREVGTNHVSNTYTTAHAQIRCNSHAFPWRCTLLRTFLGFSDGRSCYRVPTYGLEGRGSILIRTTVLRPGLGATQPHIPGG